MRLKGLPSSGKLNKTGSADVDGNGVMNDTEMVESNLMERLQAVISLREFKRGQ